MKDFKLYENNTPYPKREKSYYIYYQGECLLKEGTKHQFEMMLKDNNGDKKFITETVFNNEKYQEELDKYNKLTKKLEKEFELDLYDEFDVQNNPKREKCFEIAWNNGHSSGFENVYGWFGELVDLIK